MHVEHDFIRRINLVDKNRCNPGKRRDFALRRAVKRCSTADLR